MKYINIYRSVVIKSRMLYEYARQTTPNIFMHYVGVKSVINSNSNECTLKYMRVNLEENNLKAAICGYAIKAVEKNLCEIQLSPSSVLSSRFARKLRRDRFSIEWARRHETKNYGSWIFISNLFINRVKYVV